MQAMLSNEQVWTRQYGGSPYEFMLTPTYELVPVNSEYYSPIEDQSNKKCLLLPTRATTVLLLSINHFLSTNMAVHVVAQPQSGKTSTMQMLDRRVQLVTNRSVEEWSSSLKRRFTYVRREGLNWLIDL
jgi:hypothetical protein